MTDKWETVGSSLGDKKKKRRMILLTVRCEADYNKANETQNILIFEDKGVFTGLPVEAPFLFCMRKDGMYYDDMADYDGSTVDFDFGINGSGSRIYDEKRAAERGAKREEGGNAGCSLCTGDFIAEGNIVSKRKALITAAGMLQR